jgi:hypothetical protein
MPHQHAAQRLIALGELRTDPLAHSPIGPAMLEAVRAIALQVSRIEEGLHQGALHGGAERGQALAALQKDVGGLNRQLRALQRLANTFFHALSEVLTVLSLHVDVVKEELGQPMPAPSTQVQSSLSAIKVAARCLQAVATGADRRQARHLASANEGPNGPAQAAIALQRGRGQRQRVTMRHMPQGEDDGHTDAREGRSHRRKPQQGGAVMRKRHLVTCGGIGMLATPASLDLASRVCPTAAMG